MFSGIIEALEKPVSIKNERGGIAMVLPMPRGWKIQASESISIDGICSTVEKTTSSDFEVFYMPETIAKTHLSMISNEHYFNLERSLTMNGLLGGHLVSGHIDTVGAVRSIEKDEGSMVLTIEIPEEFERYIIYKGSVAINGVSLTVMSIKGNLFAVSLIPHTLKLTNLKQFKVGDKVNIEVDLIAKYLEKLVKNIP